MNKILMLLVLFCSFAYGQKIIVTPEGLRNSEEPEKTFVVINIEGKDAKQLYDASIKYINKTYKDPEFVIKGNVPSEFIKYNTGSKNFITIKNSFINTPFTAIYTSELSFKDGKVKLEIVSLDMFEKGNFKLFFKGQGAFSGYYIYNNKNELKKKDAKEQIENYFNGQIADLAKYLLKDPSEDKW